MKNIVQYAALFDAAGAELNFDTRSATLEVLTPNKVEAEAIEDIALYENTANYTDGIAAVFHASYIDGKPTSFSREQRDNVLNELNIKMGDKFISQYLATQKTNRSWHTSAYSHSCSSFGDECTSRGTTQVEGKRGRKSTRKPYDFHPASSTGSIAREQLVTLAVEMLYKSIPSDNIVSTANGNISIDRLKSLPPEKLEEILVAIESIKSERT
jgi:hypothetical protein